jgi:putative endopeptidase
MSGPEIDFYEWVNRSWLDDPANRIPDEYTTWGAFTQLDDAALKQQIALCQELSAGVTGDGERQVAAAWLASQQRFRDWEEDLGDYRAIREQLRHLDEVFDRDAPYTERLADYLYHGHCHGIGNVLQFDLGPNLEQSEHVVLDLATGGLSLPSREYYFDEKFADKRSEFRRHLAKVAELVDLADPQEWADRVFEFEGELASSSMTSEQRRFYDQYYTNTDLVGVYQSINELRSLPSKCHLYRDGTETCLLDERARGLAELFFESAYQRFGLREVMRKNLDKNFPSGGGPDPFHVTVYDGDALRRVLLLLFDADREKAYRSYLQYQVITSYKAFCTRALDEEFFDFYSRKLFGQEKPKSCLKRSVAVVNGYVGELAGQLYVARHFSEEHKQRVEAMVAEILAVMSRSIRDNDWLTEATKRLALEKLALFRVKIGYPDKWIDYSELKLEIGDSLATVFQKYTVWAQKKFFYEKINSRLDRERWEMTPQTVNAYYNPTQNEIVFPAAILQPPFFYQSTHAVDFDCGEESGELGGNERSEELFYRAVNFGAIGAVIAHEITHGYDDQGRKFDGRGRLKEWWSTEDSQLFAQKTELMDKQAGRYLFCHEGKKYQMNPQLTMGENLADLGGLSLSVKALLDQIKEHSPQEVRAYLKLFFKSFANVWKINIKTDALINRLTTDPHAPADFRCNLVRNIDSFYQAFRVNLGDPMYLDPAERLCMW